MRTAAMRKHRMKIAGVIGAIVGFALFIVAWLTFRTPFYAIMIPFGAIIAVSTVYLGDGIDGDD